MQIQKICNSKLSNNISTEEKHQTSFSGNLYFMDQVLDSINVNNVTQKSLASVAELVKFKRLVKSIAYEDLDVFVWEMPPSEADTVKMRQFGKPSLEKLENIKIMYHDNKTHSIKLSGLYLEPNPQKNRRIAKKNNEKLFDNLVANAMDSLNDFAKKLENFLNDTDL